MMKKYKMYNFQWVKGKHRMKKNNHQSNWNQAMKRKETFKSWSKQKAQNKMVKIGPNVLITIDAITVKKQRLRNRIKKLT